MSGDIELEIGAGARPGCYEVRVVRSAGGGEPSGRFIVDIAEILARRRELETAVLASSASVRQKVTSVEQPVREVGQRLFEALFNGPVYGAYRASLGAVQQGGERLRVVLRLTAPELAALPWEALFDPETQTYLCRKEPLVRHVPAPFTQPPLEIRPPLRILGLVASPRGLPVLDVETEQQNLETALALPIADGLVELVWMHQASWEAIHSKLLGGEWHVLHFIGHGDYDVDADEGVLYLVGADGRAKEVEASRLTDLLGEARPPLRLVVLNSCSSGESGSQDLFSGTAAVLAHNGIDGVAAMQYSITDTAAIAFARGFYTGLAHGLTVDEAARSGRVEILGLGHTLEWVTPVLYVRGDTTRPFIITGKPSIAEPSRPATEATHSITKPHGLLIQDSPRRARRPHLRRRALSVSRKRLVVISGAVICAAGALVGAILATSTVFGFRPVTAAPAVAAVQPVRLIESLLGMQFAAADVPGDTSAFAPQLSASLTSLTSTSGNTPKASGLVADVDTKFAGVGGIGVDYYVFDNLGDANSYFYSSDPFSDMYRSAGSFPAAGIGDSTKCMRATAPPQSTSWGCKTLSANVVSYSWVIESGTHNGADLESDLALDAVRHLQSAAKKTPPASLPQPPGSLKADSLYTKLNSTFPAMLVPRELSSPAVSSTSQSDTPGIVSANGDIGVVFQGSGPDYSSSWIDFWVFRNAQDAQSWFSKDLIPEDPAGKAETRTNHLPFHPSAFSSSQQEQCNTYSYPAGAGYQAGGDSVCYVQWGNVVVDGGTRENATPGNREPSAADSNMALALTWAALLRVAQAIAP